MLTLMEIFMSKLNLNDKSWFGQLGDLAKITAKAAVVNTTKTMVVSMNVMDGVEALLGASAAEITGKVITLDQIRDPNVNIFCPDGQFIPSSMKEEQAEESDASSSEKKEEELPNLDLLSDEQLVILALKNKDRLQKLFGEKTE